MVTLLRGTSAACHPLINSMWEEFVILSTVTLVGADIYSQEIDTRISPCLGKIQLVIKLKKLRTFLLGM
jgi:hypothetical protein